MPKILGNQVLQLQRKFLKVNFRFLQETARDYLCQKLKLDRICLVEKLKTFMAAAKCFHLAKASSHDR